MKKESKRKEERERAEYLVFQQVVCGVKTECEFCTNVAASTLFVDDVYVYFETSVEEPDT